MKGVAEKAGRAAAPATAREQGPRGRGRRAALGVVVVVAAGAVVAAWRAGVLSPAVSSEAAQQGAVGAATAAVTRQDLSATTPVTATLGYAGSYAMTGRSGGTLTWLPSPGQMISQGQALYRIDNGGPVALLYGSVPDWRAMSEGTTGADVSQLNHDLVALGDADRADIIALGWDYYSWETAYGVRELEERLGVSWPSGSLSLGQVAFEPEALRVSQVTGGLGDPASGPVLAATSDRHVVTVPLDVSDQSEVKAGDTVTVTLPDGTTTPGVVSSVGAVATTASGQQGQAPATLAQARGDGQPGGGYDVEVVGPGNARRWVPVTPGPVFDDNSGLVQVTGALTPGQRVVVASS